MQFRNYTIDDAFTCSRTYYKTVLIIIFSFLNGVVNSQEGSKTGPVSITTSFATSFIKLNSNLFSNAKISQGYNSCFSLSKGGFKSVGLQINVDYGNYNMRGALSDRYFFLYNTDPQVILESSKSKYLNGLISLEYQGKLFGQKGLLDISIGGGVQSLQPGNNTMSYRNPFRNGLQDTVFHTTGSKVGPVTQAGIHFTYLFNCSFGINLGARVQYSFVKTPVLYSDIRPAQGNKITQVDYQKSQKINGTMQNAITFLPEIGLTFRFCKRSRPEKKETTRPNTGCGINIGLTNINSQAACYDSATLRFNLANQVTNSILRVYVAPLADLADRRYLTTLPGSATNYSVATGILEPGVEYYLIVETMVEGEIRCASGSKIPPRCDERCITPLPQKKTN